MNGLIAIVGAFLLAAGVIFVTNWLALIPWRRSHGKHWSEQARLLFPVRRAASANLWSVPATMTLGAALLWMNTQTWMFVGFMSLAGAFSGTLFTDHEIFPRIALRWLLRMAATNCLLRFLNWFVFIAAVLLMPADFNPAAFAIAAAVVLFWIVWSRDGFIRLWLKIGLLTAAPDRLRRIVTDTSAKMGVPFREVLLICSPTAQAYALLNTRRLLFTERLLEICSDEEIAAICAHELGHLSENWRTRYARYAGILPSLTWIFLVPTIHTFGAGGLFGLGVISIAAPRLIHRLRRNMETRADRMAKVNESDEGTYARALLLLYENNLIPAAIAKNRAIHPDLYDRMLSAGVTPDFPRPLPAKTMAWHGRIFSILAGILFGIVLIQYSKTLGLD